MMHFVYEESFVHPVSTNLSLWNCKKKLVFVSKFSPWNRFSFPRKRITLLWIVLRSKCDSCFDCSWFCHQISPFWCNTAFLPSISIRCPSMTGGRCVYFRRHIRRMISVIPCSYICRIHMFVVIFFRTSLGVLSRRAAPVCKSLSVAKLLINCCIDVIYATGWTTAKWRCRALLRLQPNVMWPSSSPLREILRVQNHCTG